MTDYHYHLHRLQITLKVVVTYCRLKLSSIFHWIISWVFVSLYQASHPRI